VKLGLITYNSLYLERGTGIITSPSIQQMSVLGADGIYQGIKRIVMDFTLPPIRKIEFLF
jgi:hypothetical protein